MILPTLSQVSTTSQQINILITPPTELFVHTMQGSQFSVNEVEVVTATVDLDEVVRYRGRLLHTLMHICVYMHTHTRMHAWTHEEIHACIHITSCETVLS